MLILLKINSMFKEFLVDTIKQISGETIANMLDVRKKDLNDELFMLNHSPRSHGIPAQLYEALSTRIKVTKEMIKEGDTIVEFLKGRKLLTSNNTNSLFRIGESELSMLQLIKARSARAVVKTYSTPGKHISSQFKIKPNQLMGFYLVAGDYVPGYNSFQDYQATLLDTLGMDDEIFSYIQDHIDVTDIVDSTLDNLSDELLSHIF